MAIAKNTGNFLLNILRGAAQPFRRGVGIGQELVRKGAGLTPEEFQQKQKQAQNMGLAGKAVSGVSQKTQLSQEERQDPLIALKALLGQGAFFVPGGKAVQGASKASNLARILAPGATSGALAGFGASRKGEELPGTLGGAAIGAATSGAFEGLKSIGSRIAGRSSSKAPTITGKKLKSDPFFTKQKEQLGEVAEQLGITDRMDSNQKVKVLETQFKNVQSQVDDILSKNPQVDQSKLLGYLDDELLQTEFADATPSQRRFLDRLLSRIGEAGDDSKAINSLKSELRGELSNAFRAIEKGNTPTVKDQAKLAVWKSLKRTLDDISTEVRDLNNLQKNMFDLAEEFVPAAKKSTEKVAATIPLTNLSVQTPITEEGAQRAISTAGRAVATPVTAPASALSKLLGLAGQVEVPQAARNIVSSSIIEDPQDQQAEQQQPTEIEGYEQFIESGLKPETVSNLASRGVTPEQIQQFFQSAQGGGQQQQQSFGLGGVQITPEMASLAALMLPSKEAARIQTAFKIQQDAAKQEGSSPSSSAASNVLSTLKNNYEEIQEQGLTAKEGGAVSRLVGGAKGKAAAITQSSPEAATYNDTVEAFMSLISRGLGEKGVLTDKDISRVRKAIPGFSDSPETAAKKWSQIESILNEAKEKESELFSNNGGTDDTSALLQLLQSQGAI